MILSRFNELENNKDLKNEFIWEIFNSCGRDKDYGITRTLVNAVIRIVKSNKVIEVLEYVVDSARINKEEPRPVKMTKERSIKSNQKF